MDTADSAPVFATGLNRRYSTPGGTAPRRLTVPVDSVTYTVTRPYLPPEHWSLDPVDGGGRLISEGEHFLDLCHLLIGRPPLSVYARALGQDARGSPHPERLRGHRALRGAVANIVFDESAGAEYPQERLTVLAKGKWRHWTTSRKLTLTVKVRLGSDPEPRWATRRS